MHIKHAMWKINDYTVRSAADINTNRMLDNFASRLAALEGRPPAVRRCRICFLETEGSSQCQGNRHSCSSWSDSPGWTEPFRDDIYSRGGGCKYQWSIQCQHWSHSTLVDLLAEHCNTSSSLLINNIAFIHFAILYVSSALSPNQVNT